MEHTIIIGAGLAGLSAAIRLAEADVSCRLVSVQPSERAQSVLAEGGINGALDTMGEDDCTENHYNDTLRAGCYLADPEAVRHLTEEAPGIIGRLSELGVPFYRRDGKIQQRNFGGQKKKRTAYAASSTGKVLMSALIDEARRYEVMGRIRRYQRHEFLRLLTARTDAGSSAAAGDMAAEHANGNENTGAGTRPGTSGTLSGDAVIGAVIRDTVSGESFKLYGPVILAFGGLAGFFPAMTTGTTANSGAAAAAVFAQGVAFSNLEMIQYHPTTIGITGKRLLVSEAARGEGGRLYILRDEKPWYFMEEKYPELGNLMPRDVISREMYFVLHDPTLGGQVYLDLTGLSADIWSHKLPDLRRELRYYLGIDPAVEPVPVAPGIHYFMGGIDVDAGHRTSLPGLYAAGECCSQYHGANRLGGNSLLGAICGGKTAAETLLSDRYETGEAEETEKSKETGKPDMPERAFKGAVGEMTASWAPGQANVSPARIHEIRDILLSALGIARNGRDLEKAKSRIRELLSKAASGEERNRLYLAEAMLASAELRKESRGAHYREDYPKTEEEYRGRTLAVYRGETDGEEASVRVSLEKCLS